MRLGKVNTTEIRINSSLWNGHNELNDSFGKPSLCINYEYLNMIFF